MYRRQQINRLYTFTFMENLNELLGEMANGIKDLAREDARHKRAVIEIGMRPVVLFYEKVKNVQTFQPDVIVFLGCVKDYIEIYHQSIKILEDLENFNYDDGDFIMELQFKSIQRCYEASAKRLEETKQVMESVASPRTIRTLSEELQRQGML